MRAYVLAGLVVAYTVAYTVATAGAGLDFAAERGVQNLGRWPARLCRRAARPRAPRLRGLPRLSHRISDFGRPRGQVPLRPQGGKRHEPVSHKELDDAIEAIRHMPRLRIFAVKAELVEQEKEHRDIRQEALSAIFGADQRILLIWTGWLKEEGIEGLRMRGGQGRKPSVPCEGTEKAIKNRRRAGRLAPREKKTLAAGARMS